MLYQTCRCRLTCRVSVSRLALQRPKAIKAIISQNGNAYEDGFGKDFWAPVKKVWEDPSKENLAALEKVTSFGVTKWQVCTFALPLVGS